MDEDSFFELLSRFQSKRMDDQRCTLSIDSNKENQPEQVQQPVAPRREGGSVSSTGSTNGTTTPSDSGASESFLCILLCGRDIGVGLPLLSSLLCLFSAFDTATCWISV